MSRTFIPPVSHDGSQPAASTGYSELRRTVKASGLLAKQPGYYTLKVGLIFGLLGCSLATLWLTRSFPVQALNAVLYAFVFAQLGLLGHDAGHSQIFRSERANTLFGCICGNVLLGMDLGWWRQHHNAHHNRPNQEQYDPDADIPLLAFTPQQAERRRGLFRWSSRYQAFVMPFLACWQVFDLHVESAIFLAHRRRRLPSAEGALLLAHFVLYAGVLLVTQGPLHGLLFAVIQRIVSGVYLTAIFAPNHTAMPLFTADDHMDFVQQQVITARNIRVPRWLEFPFGGLHLQIEHHLFPGMARNQLRRAQPLVRAFCQDRGLPYREVGFLAAYGEIFRHMWRISRAMPGGSAPAPSSVPISA